MTSVIIDLVSRSHAKNEIEGLGNCRRSDTIFRQQITQIRSITAKPEVLLATTVAGGWTNITLTDLGLMVY